MNITRLNFVESLPFVNSIIKKSHFLAFDLEMSGILTEEITSPYLLDSVSMPTHRFRNDIRKINSRSTNSSLFNSDYQPFKLFPTPISIDLSIYIES